MLHKTTKITVLACLVIILPVFTAFSSAEKSEILRSRSKPSRTAAKAVYKQLPIIDAITPSQASPGDTVTITGENFGEYTADPGYDPDADMNCDGEVRFADFAILANAYTGANRSSSNYDPTADTDHDGDVDFADFSALANAYAKTCGTSYVEFHNGIIGKVEEDDWSDTQIICTVPYPAETGPVTVTTEHGTSNAVTFTVE